jgi:hypothetical protein
VTTPAGHPVELRRLESAGGGPRVHLISPASDELYFEVGRYPDTTPEEAYARFTADVAGRVPEAVFTELRADWLGGRPGFRFGVQLPDRRRVVWLLPATDALYRIVYNPESAVNEQVLATVSVNS